VFAGTAFRALGRRGVDDGPAPRAGRDAAAGAAVAVLERVWVLSEAAMSAGSDGGAVDAGRASGGAGAGEPVNVTTADSWPLRGIGGPTAARERLSCCAEPR